RQQTEDRFTLFPGLETHSQPGSATDEYPAHGHPTPDQFPGIQEYDCQPGYLYQDQSDLQRHQGNGGGKRA
ncbi:MAG: hypothetical protein KJZ57_09835, partial [Anaerolineales bacterium]|nr:hypothetical protein [Anaerolineales bacterium]